MEGFKVVDNTLKSCIMSDYNEVQYKINEWVKPNVDCGPLCVFSSLITAKAFTSSNRIYECEYDESDVDMVWTYDRTIVLSALPSNTVLATRVRLIRRVV